MVTTDNGTINVRTNIGDNNGSDGIGTNHRHQIVTGPRPGLIRY